MVTSLVYKIWVAISYLYKTIIIFASGVKNFLLDIQGILCIFTKWCYAEVAEQADALDSKSSGLRAVRVQLPPSALHKAKLQMARFRSRFFGIYCETENLVVSVRRFGMVGSAGYWRYPPPQGSRGQVSPSDASPAWWLYLYPLAWENVSTSLFYPRSEDCRVG